MSYCESRMAGSETKRQVLSRLLNVSATHSFKFTSDLGTIEESDRIEFANVLHRPPVDEEKAKIAIEKYERSLLLKAPPASQGSHGSQLSRQGSQLSRQGSGHFSQSQGSGSGWKNGPGGILTPQASQSSTPVARQPSASLMSSSSTLSTSSQKFSQRMVLAG